MTQVDMTVCELAAKGKHQTVLQYSGHITDFARGQRMLSS